jgi:hypothetical protein
MPKIKTVLGPQAFELIRERIAIILADEFEGQYLLTYDPDFGAMKVFVESANPNDKEDLPVINLSFAMGSYPLLKEYNGEILGTYVYNVDVYCSSPSDDTADGDNLSGVKLQKLIGLCRAILDNPIYRTLNYNPGFVQRVSVQDINIQADSKDMNNDALNTRMGRITFSVEVLEKVGLLTGNPLLEAYATASVNQTNDGHYYSGLQ